MDILWKWRFIYKRMLFENGYSLKMDALWKILLFENFCSFTSFFSFTNWKAQLLSPPIYLRESESLIYMGMHLPPIPILNSWLFSFESIPTSTNKFIFTKIEHLKQVQKKLEIVENDIQQVHYFFWKCNSGVRNILNKLFSMIERVGSILNVWKVGKLREAIDAYKQGGKLLYDSLRCISLEKSSFCSWKESIRL